MNPEDIFHAALATTPIERSTFLAVACGKNEALRCRIEALLQAHENPGSFLANRPPMVGATVDEPIGEAPGTIIGPYKLLEQIGEGGMGTVWMAQQSEPVKRVVALKLIKAGMDSKQVIARFEAERQALALMDHANVARVLDAGTTDAGRPYFVMDLVKGVPITEHCDQHHLTPRERVELFVPVCQAVQHAHQRGIIHRDLKPSNMLVTLYDGKPVPKVIDFGVAKATEQKLTEQTLVTGFGAIVGTLEYMSPEQVEINQLDIDTRSDIYALGVLLYELLTGSPPFSRKEFEKAGMLEMLRLIREQEPSKPSTKLSTAEGLPILAANRNTEPAKLTKLVRGELDWIVMKALEKDRNRRYESANALAMDLQRYLAGEAVQAVPPSVGYRLRKFLWRNRALMGAAALVVAGVLVAVASLATSNIRLAQGQEETTKALKSATQAKMDLQESVTRQRQNLYDYAFGMARRDWLAADIDQARRNLQVCPPELRDLEWEHLHRVCNSELLRIEHASKKLQYSPDGKYLVGVVGRVAVWDSTSGERHPKFNLTVTGNQLYYTAVFSPEGNELILATNGEILLPFVKHGSLQPGFRVTVWDLVEGKPSAEFFFKGSRGRAVLSPDGCRVTLVEDDPDRSITPFRPPKSVSVCDTRTGKAVSRLAVPNDQPLQAVAFHPNGQVLTVSLRDQILRFWDGTTGHQIREASLTDFAMSTIALSQDGRLLATVRPKSKVSHRIEVWDLQTGQLIAAIRGHSGELTLTPTLVFSPDGRRLATGGSDKAVMIWDVDSGRELFTFRGHTNEISDVVFSPDGRRVASTDGKTVRIWDVRPFEKSRGEFGTAAK